MTLTVPPALLVDGLSKSFAGTPVLRDARLEVAAGEIHALVGENGSGKSTLVKILAGYHEPDPGGSVAVAGKPLHLGHPEWSAHAGLRFVHQDLGLVGSLDCIDNMALGHGYPVSRAGRIQWRNAAAAATAALASLGYSFDLRQSADSLSASERTALATARALSTQRGPAAVLVVDEPTANLDKADVQRLFVLLRQVRDTGVAVVFISHHFSEVFNLADRVTILRDGEVVGTYPVSALDEHDLVELMIGRSLAVAGRRDAPAVSDDSLLKVRALSGRILADLNLDVGAGEIVGVAGVTGSGREELAGRIFGAQAGSGSVSVGSTRIEPGRPDLALAAGVGYVPADRSAKAILHEHSVTENVTIADLRPYVRNGFLRHKRERSDVAELLNLFHVRPSQGEAPISSLSGGNQQKVMLARALRLKPRILVLDEPTQGVDVGAQADIHRMLREVASGGAAVLVCSSSSEELAEISDRVVVLFGGRVVADFAGPVNSDEITAAVLATAAESAA